VVDDISFASRQKQHGIRIELKIQKEYASLITSSSQASIKNLGMLGDKYVDISLGDVDDQPLNEGSFIKSQPSVDLDFFMERASSLFQMLDTTLVHITSITNAAKKGKGTLGMLIQDQSTRDHLVKSLKNIDQIISGIMRGEGTLGKMTRDTLLYQRLFSSADGVSNLTHKINNGQGSLGKFVNDSTFYLKWLNVSIKTDSLLTKLQGEGTTGKLLRDKQLYQNLVSLTQTLNELMTDLKKNPDKYVKFELF
jgi:phospholipid/cholesterol/gamma-HCH transport system substrate-binding protein